MYALFLLTVISLSTASVWQGFKDVVGVSDEPIRGFYQLKEPSLGGPYPGSNQSMGGFVLNTPAGLSAGMNFVADFNSTGNLSINFNLDNDPALSLTCVNGQTGIKMTTLPGSCKRRVGINTLNPQCDLDVNSTICVNGAPIFGQDLPLAWYYSISSFSPCNTTRVQQYFTPKAIDQVTTQGIDTVFVGYQGGAIAFTVNNNTASFGDCRGTNAVDFQVIRAASSQVASGVGAFIAGSGQCTASGTRSVAIGSATSVASSTSSVSLGCTGCQNSGGNSVVIGTNVINSGLRSLVVGSAINSGVVSSVISGDQHTISGGSNSGEMFISGFGINLNFASQNYGSSFLGIGLKVTVNTTFSCGLTPSYCPMMIIGRYNDPDNIGITTAPRMFTIGDGGDDTTRSNLFSVLSNGDVHTKLGGTYVTGGADYGEYLESEQGPKRLPIGTTIKITDEGKFRVAVAGEIPDGVISRRGGFLGNSDNHHWVGKYELDEYTGKIKLDRDGNKVLSKGYDPTKPYIPRSERPEWHTIGFVGQCEVLIGAPVSPNWIPMHRKSGALKGTKWYFIK